MNTILETRPQMAWPFVEQTLHDDGVLAVRIEGVMTMVATSVVRAGIALRYGQRARAMVVDMRDACLVMSDEDVGRLMVQPDLINVLMLPTALLVRPEQVPQLRSHCTSAALQTGHSRRLFLRPADASTWARKKALAPPPRASVLPDEGP